jgi:hypothetical protein
MWHPILHNVTAAARSIVVTIRRDKNDYEVRKPIMGQIVRGECRGRCEGTRVLEAWEFGGSEGRSEFEP